MSGADPDDVVAHAAASSTTTFEAAVVLESGGITDRVAATRFGAPDVFTLAELCLADPRRGVSDPAVAPASVGWTPLEDRRWVRVRGLLYAIPALVALALLPGRDPVSAGLVLGGLLAAWAAGYGVASVAWSYLGNRDRPAARLFLRRALVAGIAAALVLATVAVFAALILTSTTSVDLSTILLLAGQAAYLLGAATLLLCGREAWLLAALAPALVGAVLGLLSPRGAPVSALGAQAGTSSRDLLWPAASVVLTCALALLATRDARPPVAPLPTRAWGVAAAQVAYGLCVAVLVVFPALDQLVAPDYDPLPLAVTALALPLVLCMGLAEWFVLRFRERTTVLLNGTGSTAEFGRAARREAVRAHARFAAALGVATLVVGGLVVAASSGAAERRAALLAADYLVLGLALLAAALLTVLGRGLRALAALASAVVALLAFLAVDQHVPTSTTTALLCHVGVGVVLLVVLAALVWRTAAVPVRHR